MNNRNIEEIEGELQAGYDCIYISEETLSFYVDRSKDEDRLEKILAMGVAELIMKANIEYDTFIKFLGDKLKERCTKGKYII